MPNWRFRLGRRLVEVPLEGPLILNDATMALDAALEGVGLMQLPVNMVARELADGRLVTVLDDFQPPPIDGFYLYYPGRRQFRPTLKALVDFLREDRRKRRR